MKEAIYYQRDKYNAPRVTVCLMKDDNGIVCRGLALCSFDDNPTKKDIEKTYTLPIKNSKYDNITVIETLVGGRTIAQQRAADAFIWRCSGGVIQRKEAVQVIESVNDSWFLKSQYDIKPKNKFEEKLIRQMN